ncbi:serine--tRNA ligase, mitochondrial-like, partial [Centruroides sculpturatus]|uniref:serine--tRNA ligase, mitochondrial-like n=1 Tax=Centruroides sculpturatus TaxID=218467 RepID=UPI000C6E9882
MFGVTANETKSESEEFLNKLLSIQKEFISDFGLHFKVLDMPSVELAAAAYRKYDIEAWMPGKGLYGEVTSASNCTDYQSRRLGIKYYNKDNILKFAHTVNGTACAIPRLITSIFETHQNKDGSVTIPEVLRPYMNGLEKIDKSASSEIMYYMMT